jgi:alkylation response protein AidB-like acyl-CoA dehydrogenase
MNFDPSEEQQLLAASIARFVERDYTFEKRRAIVSSPEGWSRDVWRTMADMGLLGLTLPTDHGGFGGGAVDAMALMEAIGDALIVEPWLATVALGARLVAEAGSDVQKKCLLVEVAEGRRTMAFAHAEAGARHSLPHVAARAVPDGDGFVLHGRKLAVANAHAAETLVVSARVAGATTDREGIGLFLVDRGTSGMSTRALRMLDGTRAADVGLVDVHVSRDACLGAPGDALPVVEATIDFATALLCAEAVGAIRAANDATLEYLKTRKQFGVPIGTFQALQHRMVDLAIELEQVKSMASLACTAVDAKQDRMRREGPPRASNSAPTGGSEARAPDGPPRGRASECEARTSSSEPQAWGDHTSCARTVSAAKVRIADACRRVSQESVQLHGGMGMSDELEISHTFRRLTALAQQFGDADHHLARLAALDP